jgi:hypothetical protein
MVSAGPARDTGIFVFDERLIVLHDAPRCDPKKFFAAIRAGDSFASAIVEHGRFELHDGDSSRHLPRTSASIQARAHAESESVQYGSPLLRTGESSGRRKKTSR